MESNAHEDSKSSSEESDRSEQPSDDMGTGRSYECVFCKRGFTTAQALGGHMNIHRKDRAKNRPSSVPSISDKADGNYASFRSCTPVQSYPTNHFALASEVHVNYQTFFPTSTWNERSQHSNHSNDFYSYGNNPQHLNLFGDDVWRGNLSLRVGPSHVPEDKEEREVAASDEDDELDLELRLVYLGLSLWKFDSTCYEGKEGEANDCFYCYFIEGRPDYQLIPTEFEGNNDLSSFKQIILD